MVLHAEDGQLPVPHALHRLVVQIDVRELEVLRPRVDERGRTKALDFELRNRSPEQQSFAYAIVWSDRSDKRVGSPQRTWTLLTLDGGASVSLSIPFPADGAESWRLLAVRPEEVR